jgi:hypothetical protein
MRERKTWEEAKANPSKLALQWGRSDEGAEDWRSPPPRPRTGRGFNGAAPMRERKTAGLRDRCSGTPCAGFRERWRRAGGPIGSGPTDRRPKPFPPIGLRLARGSRGENSFQPPDCQGSCVRVPAGPPFHHRIARGGSCHEKAYPGPGLGGKQIARDCRRSSRRARGTSGDPRREQATTSSDLGDDGIGVAGHELPMGAVRREVERLQDDRADQRVGPARLHEGVDEARTALVLQPDIGDDGPGLVPAIGEIPLARTVNSPLAASRRSIARHRPHAS